MRTIDVLQKYAQAVAAIGDIQMTGENLHPTPEAVAACDALQKSQGDLHDSLACTPSVQSSQCIDILTNIVPNFDDIDGFRQFA